jgi:hypothetical protein
MSSFNVIEIYKIGDLNLGLQDQTFKPTYGLNTLGLFHTCYNYVSLVNNIAYTKVFKI